MKNPFRRRCNTYNDPRWEWHPSLGPCTLPRGHDLFHHNGGGAWWGEGLDTHCTCRRPFTATADPAVIECVPCQARIVSLDGMNLADLKATFANSPISVNTDGTLGVIPEEAPDGR